MSTAHHVPTSNDFSNEAELLQPTVGHRSDISPDIYDEELSAQRHRPLHVEIGEPEAAFALTGSCAGVLLGCLICAVLIAPMLFGSVHPENRLLLQAIFFLSAAYLFFTHFSSLRSFWLDFRELRVAIGISVCIAALVPLHNLLLAMVHYEHSVLGTIGSHTSWPALLNSWMGGVTWIVVFSFTILYTRASSIRQRRVRLLFLVTGAVVSATALTHWFYDNGLLFWTFTPEFVGVSNRARWPFVNPNHLGHFLIPLFFLTLAELEILGQTLFRSLDGLPRSDVHQLLSRPAFHKDVMVLAVLFLLLSAVVIAILASLSRSSWIALACGGLVYFACTRLLGRTGSSESHSKDHRSSSSRATTSGKIRKIRRKKSAVFKLHFLKKVGGAFTFLLVLCFAFFLLSGRGTDLLYERLDYAVAHSLDDIRLIMYQHTLTLIRDHIWLGVGLGQWESNFFAYMPATLADLNPEFLHNDPLQLFAELGIFGLLPILAAVVFSEIWAIRVLLANKDLNGGSQSSVMRYSEQHRRFLALFIGINALLLASFFDFPFRIPAITYLSAGLCGLLLVYGSWLRGR
jgi:O-antigen ligase